MYVLHWKIIGYEYLDVAAGAIRYEKEYHRVCYMYIFRTLTQISTIVGHITYFKGGSSKILESKIRAPN